MVVCFCSREIHTGQATHCPPMGFRSAKSPTPIKENVILRANIVKSEVSVKHTQNFNLILELKTQTWATN